MRKGIIRHTVLTAIILLLYFLSNHASQTLYADGCHSFRADRCYESESEASIQSSASVYSGASTLVASIVICGVCVCRQRVDGQLSFPAVGFRQWTGCLGEASGATESSGSGGPDRAWRTERQSTVTGVAAAAISSSSSSRPQATPPATIKTCQSGMRRRYRRSPGVRRHLSFNSRTRSASIYTLLRSSPGYDSIAHRI